MKAKKDPIVTGQENLLKNQEKTSTKKYIAFLEETKKSLLNKLKSTKALKTINIVPKNGEFESFIGQVAFLKRINAARKDQGEDLVKLLFENWDDWIGILVDSIKDDHTIGMEYGGKIAIARVEAAVKFDMQNERAQAWIEDTALKNAKSIVGTLKDDLRKVILDSIQEGQGSQGVADALQEAYSNLEDWKALLIARTELCNSYSQGTLEGYRQSDVVSGKKWLTVGEACDECGENEEQGAIGLDDNFKSGDDAPAAHPQCRCCITPVVSKE